MLSMSLGEFELTQKQSEQDLATRKSRSETRSRRVDAAAAQIAHSRGAVELALGETLARLFDGDGLIRLGYARQVD